MATTGDPGHGPAWAAPPPAQSSAADHELPVASAGRAIATLEQARVANALLDLHKSDPKYKMRSLRGDYSALTVASIMYSAFQLFAPGTALGIDLACEYEMASDMSGSLLLGLTCQCLYSLEVTT